ncbi:multiple sugar transport system ATP-binding protein [Rhodoferax ferrireducens]|uniref:Multiple sugar transport system ATP-binding protein n=1 Tax=Rhodoferax ferrireducens TaxID=192843 RepID=A0ABU2CB41_9BURK|nr:sn-glycerol-3-phosphate ABC transporter ATP-binding protein UgpC [Rhodoferax ferrireducens]MDR7378553.1 multiple sugar transport system ATP-binding protein [Rhodoferax ferrireducens]
MASVTLSGIEKSFANTQVIRGVDIAIGDGEFAVFVGPSGCGKSTLLRMLAGLDAPDAGQIRIGDKVVNGLPPKERGVSMVFQTYALYPHMTVQDNMGFGLMIAGTPPGTIASKVAGAAKMLGLDKMLDRLPRQLSGGQRQRVAMGRAMVRDPQVFLFDEPLSNLDAKLRVQMRTEIRALHQRLKTTSVYVTHDQIEAMTMADRIIVLRDGKVEQIGTPAELYDRPCNSFVATFIGSPAMNIVAAGADNTCAIADFGGQVLLRDTFASLGSRRVLLGLRPEHLQVRPAGEANGIPCEVKVVEFSGADTLLTCEAQGQPVQALVHDRLLVKPGDNITLAIDPARVHVFDEATQQRL